MSTKRRIKGHVRLPLGILTLTLVGPGPAPAAEPAAAAGTPVYTVLIADKATSFAVRRALDGAHRRLAEAGCQAVLSDFEDLSGRRLRDKLDARGGRGSE